MEKKRIPGLEACKMHGIMEYVKYSIIAGVKSGGVCNGKKVWNEVQSQCIQCPKSQAKEISFLSIFTEEPLKDFEQEVFSDLCIRKIYLAKTIR